MRFISTTIPYVNGAPHIGHAQEFVLADVLARSYPSVYFHSGADENSLKNVLAAKSLGIPVDQFVAQRSDEFEDLTGYLGLNLTDFLRTSSDARHRPVVESLWMACQSNGDIYKKHYTGLYCAGCEQFFTPDELTDGLCPEHLVAPETVTETNYFFRLTRYRDALGEIITSRELNIEPESKRNETLATLAKLSDDISVSRSMHRAHGWGIPVPDDPSQVVYVWIDALANYVSGPGLCQWRAFERVTHVVGKGVLRFHAIYWPAVLLSAGWRLPDDIFVHNYVTVEGCKIGKSLGNAIHPREPLQQFGLDAFRYYLIRHIGCFRDGDFSAERFRTVYEHELVNQLGNLVSRLATLLRQEKLGLTEPRQWPDPVVLSQIETHCRRFALHKALEIVWTLIEQANGYLSNEQPWKLEGDQRRYVLSTARDKVLSIAQTLRPFLPSTAERIPMLLDGRCEGHLFPRDR